MKKLDNIFLEDIKSFDILDKKLIIYTKDEKLEYTYPTNLELLRKISYFIHRYRVEFEAKKNNTMKRKTTIDNEIKESVTKFCETFFNKLFNSTLALVFITCILGFNLLLLYMYLCFNGFNFVKLISSTGKELSNNSFNKILDAATLKEMENMQNAFYSLENKALDLITDLDLELLNHLKTKTDSKKSVFENLNLTHENIANFLESLPYIYKDKGHQKTLGKYPNH